MMVSMNSADIEDVIICSAGTGTHYIPSSVCKYYLYNFRANKDDIKKLQSHAGLSFVLSMPVYDEKKKLIKYLISKGIDINQPSRTDGLTPLHAAILLNMPGMVEFLIDNGASLTKIDATYKLTPMQFVKLLIEKKPSVDRSAVIALLKIK